MKHWCKKHKKEITHDEAEGRCLRENSGKGCVNLTKKRGDAKTSGPKSPHQPNKGKLPMEKFNEIDFILFQMGLLPINDKTGEGTILRELIDSQWELLRCLQSVRAKVGLILRNGKILEGPLYRVEKFRNKIRVKTGDSSEKDGIGVFADTWPREIIAVQFKVTADFKTLDFPPYQEKQKQLIDVWRNDLSETEQGLLGDEYDLLQYLLHGKYCMDEIQISLTNGLEFTGSLELVRSDRILLALRSSEKSKTYLDVYPLMISSVQFEAGSKGWPYDPREC